MGFCHSWIKLVKLVLTQDSLAHSQEEASPHQILRQQQWSGGMFLLLSSHLHCAHGALRWPRCTQCVLWWRLQVSLDLPCKISGCKSRQRTFQLAEFKAGLSLQNMSSTCNPSTWEADARGGLLGYTIRLCLSKKKRKRGEGGPTILLSESRHKEAVLQIFYFLINQKILAILFLLGQNPFCKVTARV